MNRFEPGIVGLDVVPREQHPPDRGPALRDLLKKGQAVSVLSQIEIGDHDRRGFPLQLDESLVDARGRDDRVVRAEEETLEDEPPTKFRVKASLGEETELDGRVPLMSRLSVMLRLSIIVVGLHAVADEAGENHPRLAGLARHAARVLAMAQGGVR